MTRTTLGPLSSLRRGGLWPDETRTDAELLERYLLGHDEAAFEAILRRHGPMVLGVCRRALRDPHAAEDAFQAAFLVLVRKASSVRPRERLGNWLYGVARQTAHRARAVAARRGVRERTLPELPDDAVEAVWPDDLRGVLDQELAGLPAAYRTAVVLCDLEDRSHREAAGLLGWPEGTLASRLARGRKLLARRLAARGVTPQSAAALAPVAVPPWLLTSTLRTIELFNSGVGLARSGAIAVAQGVLMSMTTTCSRRIAFAVALAVVAALGSALVAQQRATPPTQSGTGQEAKTPANDAATPTAPGRKKQPESVQITAEGKQVVVRVHSRGVEAHARAGRADYDAATRRLVLVGDVRVRMLKGDLDLEARAGRATYDGEKGRLDLTGAARLRRRQVRKSPAADTFEGSQITIDLQTGKADVTGHVKVGTGLKLHVPQLGGKPVAMDLGFPVAPPRDARQIICFSLGLWQ